MPGILNQFLIYLNPVIIFLPWNVVKEKLTLAVKPSARQRGASVTRMEFDATPFAIRIGAVTIMTMISFKQSIALDMYFHFHQ